MKALWQIILAILWRLRPVQALEVNLSDIVEMGLSLFADDEEVEELANDPQYRQTIAAALADAHRKLDLLIYLRACELTGTRNRAKDFQPNYTHTHNSTEVIALWRSLHRLVARFDAYESHALKRAERLRHEASNPPYGGPLRLDATHQSTSPGSAGGGLRDDALSPPSRETRGRWIARACAQDGGGCASSRGSAFARGPPFGARLPIADCRLPRKHNFREHLRTPAARLPFTPSPAMLVSRQTRREGGVP